MSYKQIERYDAIEVIGAIQIIYSNNVRPLGSYDRNPKVPPPSRPRNTNGLTRRDAPFSRMDGFNFASDGRRI